MILSKVTPLTQSKDSNLERLGEKNKSVEESFHDLGDGYKNEIN